MWLYLHILLTLATLPFIMIEKKGRSTATLSWIFFVWIFPFAGFCLWWLIGHEHLNRKLKRYKQTKKTDFFNYGVFPSRTVDDLYFLNSTSKFYQKLIESIEGAQTSIHLNYYIWELGEISEKIEDALLKKLLNGVEVRILIDSFGSFRMSFGQLANLKAAGAKISAFMPFNIFGKNFRFNFRNHRKTCIIDSKLALIGGINIGDVFHNWSDCAIELNGMAVLDLQEIFANDWKFSHGEDLFQDRYFHAPVSSVKSATTDEIRVIASGPDIPSFPLYDLLIEHIHLAQKSWTIVTPYFVLDPSMLTLIRIARRRSIEVSIYIPQKSDSALLDLANRSSLDSLHELGVQLYFVAPPFIHAKLQIFDQQHVILGTSNFDIRSFKLNFETSLFINSQSFSHKINEFIQEIAERSSLLNLNQTGKQKLFGRKLRDALVQIASPLL
jgi:cardiolipin synthase A/B